MAGTWRTVRVFISSTFRDMKAERDYLVKFVFPQIRKLCESRGVTFTDVDLRWGVTDEQKAEGKVLPICLEEIRRCRPYFIGLLGERYGWVPQEIPQELVDREPWLAAHREKSVTELEFLHGVLNNPAMTNRACFYFRDPNYLDTLPAKDRPDFIESDAGRSARLAALKDRIRSSGLAFREGYPDPKTLGEWILADLTAAINQEFPTGTEPTPLEREAMDHETFAQSRAGVYVGRKEYFERLDAHAAGDGPPLVVLGESGSGKSALLANWALRYRDAHPDDLVILHFIGSSSYSADWSAMLRRIMSEFKQRVGITQDIPDKPDALREAFANWLHMAAAKGCVVLVLDGLNQLEDRDAALDLVWLPPEIPSNVRMVLSTLPGRPLDNLTKRDWPTLDVKALEPAECTRLIEEYLGRYTKRLSAARAARIAGARQTANPLFLRVLLDELCVFGERERLDEWIGHYLAAKTVPELYEKVLARWEQDYEGERPGLVRDAMTCIWAARRGFADSELLDLLGSGGSPLPLAQWSPLLLAAEQSLVSRSGLIGFFHDYLREAVRHRYLPSDEKEQDAHLRLAEYFEHHELCPRKIDELPWQLAEAQAWLRLCSLLTGGVFCLKALKCSQFEVKAYWMRIEAASQLRMVDAFRAQIEHPESQSDKEFLGWLGLLLEGAGHPEEASRLHSALVEHFRITDDVKSLAGSIGNQATSFYRRGDLAMAMSLYKEQEGICRQLGDLDVLQTCLGNQALILYDRGDSESAMALMKKQERMCRRLGNMDGLQRSLGNQAMIMYSRGNIKRAMALSKKQESICQQLGNLDGLSLSLGNQAMIMKKHGDLDGAMALHEKEEQICRESGNLAGLSNSLGDQALILYSRGDLARAMALYKEEEQICQRLGSFNLLSRCLGNQALVLKDRGDLDGAMETLKEDEDLCRKVGDLDELQRSIGHQALILKERGDLKRAMALHKEAERICRQLGNLDGLSRELGNRALILEDGGDLEGAMSLHKEEEQICRQLKDNKGLAISLGNQAIILETGGDLDAAMALYKEEEGISRQLGLMELLALSLAHQSLILGRKQRVREALVKVEEAHKIASEHGYSALAEDTQGFINKLRAGG